MADQENVLKKSYVGLLLWLAAFAAVLYAVYSVAAYFCKLHVGVNCAVFIGGIVVAACATIPIKLAE